MPEFKSVLFIDDTRHVIFDCSYARTAAAAISLLPDGWHEVWFDYDLADGETIGPVIDWIFTEIDHGHKPEIDIVVIHSSNPDGADWIATQLHAHYPIHRVTADQLQRFTRTA